jgi:CubicO group peptidase (beta-lactamase class C family)
LEGCGGLACAARIVFGWAGAFGTMTWYDRAEKIAAVFML